MTTIALVLLMLISQSQNRLFDCNDSILFLVYELNHPIFYTFPTFYPQHWPTHGAKYVRRFIIL